MDGRTRCGCAGLPFPRRLQLRLLRDRNAWLERRADDPLLGSSADLRVALRERKITKKSRCVYVDHQIDETIQPALASNN
jgi:hypothetical protein